MARNFRELEAKMNPADLADNARLVRQELSRMALEELRTAKRLTQVDMAEILDLPQSSISRIERRADMYLSTLRNYIQAMGGVLQIQAVFPDGATVVINRFGEYEDRPYTVWARAEERGEYRLVARPANHAGNALATKPVKVSGFIKALKALDLPEAQISAMQSNLKSASEIALGGAANRIFNAPDLIAAGFEPLAADSAS